MRRKIVTVMLVTAVLAVGLFALPLAVLVAKYLIDDARGELTHAADVGVQSALAGSRITDGDPGGDFTVYVPVSDDGVVAGAVRATSSRTQAWLRILGAWLIMGTLAGATLGAVWFVARRQAARLAA